MRAYHNLIVIVGDGSDGDAEARARLMARLSEALEPDGRHEAEDVVRDIAMALLGRTIDLGPVVPSSTVQNGTRVRGMHEAVDDMLVMPINWP